MSRAWKKTFTPQDLNYLKNANAMVIFDHLPHMTTISCHPALLQQPFEFEYSLTNQYVGSNKVALIQSGTKFGYIIMQCLIFLTADRTERFLNLAICRDLNLLLDFPGKDGFRDYREDYNEGTHGETNGDDANVSLHD
jgi:hypothetical protein